MWFSPVLILCSSNFRISVSAPPPATKIMMGRLWDGFRKFRRDKLLASKAVWVQLLRARSLPVMGVAGVAPVCVCGTAVRPGGKSSMRGDVSRGFASQFSDAHKTTATASNRRQSPHFFFFFSFSFFFRILFEFFGIICRWCCSAIIPRSLICRDLICVVSCL